jgi:hypothetical protein
VKLPHYGFDLLVRDHICARDLSLITSFQETAQFYHALLAQYRTSPLSAKHFGSLAHVFIVYLQ